MKINIFSDIFCVYLHTLFVFSNRLIKLSLKWNDLPKEIQKILLGCFLSRLKMNFQQETFSDEGSDFDPADEITKLLERLKYFADLKMTIDPQNSPELFDEINHLLEQPYLLKNHAHLQDLYHL